MRGASDVTGRPPFVHALVEAAVSGDRDLALKALMANPLVADYAVAGPLLDALLEANREHLPAFFPA